MDRGKFIIASACLVLVGVNTKAFASGAQQQDWRNHDFVRFALTSIAIIVATLHSGLQVLRLKNARMSGWIALVPWTLAATALAVDSAFGERSASYAMEIANVVTLTYIALLLIAEPDYSRGSRKRPKQKIAKKKEALDALRSRHT